MTLIMTLGGVAVLVGLGVVVFLSIRSGSPTQSVAHVLYDTEHPTPASGPARKA